MRDHLAGVQHAVQSKNYIGKCKRNYSRNYFRREIILEIILEEIII